MDMDKGAQKALFLKKTPTGIEDFDRITGGGLPHSQTTLVTGGPGCGKTVFALQTLVNGAQNLREPGIFVAFEENTRRLIANAQSFGWDLNLLERQGKLFFLDAYLPSDVTLIGSFELTGLLAGIKAKVDEMGAKRIVFDSLDVLLILLNDPILVRREIYALRDWLSTNNLTGIITTMIDEHDPQLSSRYGFMQFMADCVVQFRHLLVDEVTMRKMRIVKYRGSDFEDGDFPMIIGRKGIDILAFTRQDAPGTVSTERVSTGVERLDAMLDGGYLRGTSMLITGAPGTSKSTLSAAFADAACRRGEKTLYATFDTRSETMVRDMASVNIHLGQHIESGMLKVYSQQSPYMSPEKHLSALKDLIYEHKPSCMVIDPMSAMIKAGGQTTAENISLQLILLTQSKGITLVSTSLMEGGDPLLEKSAIRISTIADTWIHVSFFPIAGERNRALTIIKSRGTGHSNQVIELLLTDNGITIADVYTEEGEVLMGTLRKQKEHEGERNRELMQAELESKKRQMEQAELQTLAHIEALKAELESQRAALKVLNTTEKEQHEQSIKIPELMGKLRGGDKV